MALSGKWERERNASAMRAQAERDAAFTAQLHRATREVERLRRFLRLISEPLPIDVLAAGDFKAIAQVLSMRIALAGDALSGHRPPLKDEGAAGKGDPVSVSTSLMEPAISLTRGPGLGPGGEALLAVTAASTDLSPQELDSTSDDETPPLRS